MIRLVRLIIFIRLTKNIKLISLVRLIRDVRMISLVRYSESQPFQILRGVKHIEDCRGRSHNIYNPGRS